MLIVPAAIALLERTIKSLQRCFRGKDYRALELLADEFMVALLHRRAIEQQETLRTH